MEGGGTVPKRANETTDALSNYPFNRHWLAFDGESGEAKRNEGGGGGGEEKEEESGKTGLLP